MLKPINYHQLGPKNIEHHIERHYEINSDKTLYLQRIPVKVEFYEERLKHCLSVPGLPEVDLLLLDEHGTADVFEEFEYLHYSTFISFFRGHLIDIPRCFRKTYSVRRRINENDFLKFNNYLMRSGLRTRCWYYLSEVLTSITSTHIENVGPRPKDMVT